MTEKLNVARIKRAGETFEISIDPDNALKYRKGEINDLREVLLADHIFTDARKGQVASDDELQKAFSKTDVDAVADFILKHGEIQVTSEHRAQEREQRWRKLVNLIHKHAVDPKTGLPHPAARIEAALEQGKVHLDDHKTIDEQFDGIISKLRPIIPLKIEQKILLVTVPSQYSGKAYNVVKSGVKVLSENWNTDGSWTVTVEMPAGMVPEYIDKLNSATHGEVSVEEK
ncbi:ribosome assembly factor SBDS [Candidatus Woesearchaeota archaeon CG10_big_fil_rev_8_21_14_0_10_45_16]|nr:MAG: ribosome assembly factor SBDS [Candidatus Woesearchaeota archaeon CG10_big_fil_rev_8_21_14_0_10_45_16]